MKQRPNRPRLARIQLRDGRKEPLTSVRKLIYKALTTLLIITVSAEYARLRLGLARWLNADKTNSGWHVLALTVIILSAWLITEFLFAFFIELRSYAQVSGRTAAQVVAHAPAALLTVGRRAIERIHKWSASLSFERRYKRRIYEDYGLFNDRGLGLINTARLDLDKVYVDLQIASHVGESSGNLLTDPVVGRKPVWEFLKAARPGRGLVLIGAPGSGKTTLLQNLLLVFAENRQRKYNQRRMVPIFIELRTLTELFQDDGFPTLIEAIQFYWKNTSLISDLMALQPNSWLERRLSTGKGILLLDGLDEVPHSLRERMSKWIHHQMQLETQRNCIFVITSRPGGYSSAPLSHAVVLEIQPFSREQVDHFISRWYVANEVVTSAADADDVVIRRRAGRDADDLRVRLRENQSLHELAVNPLLLTMICMVHRYRGALPGTRAQLYGEICQVLLERWRQVKGIADELTGDQKLSVLRILANEFMSRESREMGEAEVIDCISESLRNIGFLQEEGGAGGQRFLRMIQANSGLLLEKESGIWSFAHKSFQEYLAADYWLKASASIPNLHRCVVDEWWREAILLYVARTDASRVVEACLDVESPQSWALAFKCLIEAHSLLPEVRSRAERTLRWALRSVQPETFSPAANALHYLRQSEVMTIAQDVEQRGSLVTQAEYQLFLDSLDADSKRAMLPPHWSNQRFEGDPEAPVLGVWGWQGRAYANAASRGSYSADWRLPLDCEPAGVRNSSAFYWCESNRLAFCGDLNGGACSSVRTRNDHCLPDGLEENFIFDLRSVRAIAIALREVFAFRRHVGVDVASALANSLNVVLAKALGRNVERAHVLARIASFDFSVVRTAIWELSGGVGGGDDDEVGRGVVSLVGRFKSLARRVGAIGRRPGKGKAEVLSDNVGADGLSLGERRLRLCGHLEEIRSDEKTWSESTRAWRAYGSFLLTSAKSRLREAELADAERIDRALRLLNEREDGVSCAHEGILLVRDRAHH